MTGASGSKAAAATACCRVHVSLDYHFPVPTTLLLQIEAADLPDQILLDQRMIIGGGHGPVGIPGHAGLGTRRWLRLAGDLSIRYQADIQLGRVSPDLIGLEATPLVHLPAEVCDYLMPSRYCQSDLLHDRVLGIFGTLGGGSLVAAMRDWIGATLVYAPGASHSETSVMDTLASRQGVCRDYAHLLVALARAAWIPARYVSVYAPDVSPQDFHAVAEVFLAGSWHLIDPTGMAAANDMVVIGVGRDAADVPFLSSFGEARFIAQQVMVERLDPSLPPANSAR